MPPSAGLIENKQALAGESNPSRALAIMLTHSQALSTFSRLFLEVRNLRWTADSHSARGRSSEDSQALSHLHLYCLTGDNKSQEQSFCFRETLRKTLTAFFTATFRIFRGHRCILNLPYVLRIGVVLFRSPSHQPSTWDHSLQCRWLGESRPST